MSDPESSSRSPYVHSAGQSPAAVATETPNAKLSASPVFAGVISTQFWGAFNDNFFKQMVLLKCVELAAGGSSDLQGLALAAFALPFVLLSGTGGYVSDRFSKRTVIVWCKVAEVFVMGAALLVLLPGMPTGSNQLYLLILVLALMGAQSAIFGPSKYGILPELFAGRSLLPANGAIQMTTFLAIIFGMAGAGIALDSLDNSLWMCSAIAVGIAVIGTFTALLIRKTPVAEPDLRLKLSNAFIPGEIWVLLRQQPKLGTALLVMMMFWFVGGVAQPAVNTLGGSVLMLSKTRTSLMAASIGVGIALGCAVAGFANKSGNADGSRWTTRGSWMIVLSLLFIALLSSGLVGRPTPSADQLHGIVKSLLDADAIEWLLRFSMLCLGVSAGIFVVPVQVYIQEAPPADQKGRLIGAMNVITWVGILLSAGFIFMMGMITSTLSEMDGGTDYHFLVFVVLAVMMAPVARCYRLPARPTTDLKSEI